MFGYQVLGFGAGGAGSPFVEATGGTIHLVILKFIHLQVQELLQLLM